MTVRSRMFAAVAAAAAVAMMIAGCSSSGGDDGGGASTSANGATKYPEIAKQVQTLEQRPTSIGITQPLKSAPPAGKTIAFIQCGSPICASMGENLADGAAALNWKVNRINAGLTAETIKAAWGQAVNSNADAVITSGTPRSLYESELQKLAAKKIPVINLTTADPAGNGITQVFAGPDEWGGVGKNLADYMLVKSTDTLRALAVTVSAYPNLGLISKALESEIKSNCSDCTFETLDVPASSIGSDLPTRVTSYLSAHPKINWVYMGFSDMVTGLPAALNSAGLGKIKMVTISSNPTIATYIDKGQSLMMDAGFDVYELLWRSLDYLARVWTNSDTSQTTDPKTMPVWLITKETQPSTTDNFPFVADYQQQYKKLWNVS